MGVRVRVEIRVGGKSVYTSALLNSGFETDSPQIVVPARLLRRHGIAPEDLGHGRLVEYDTAGGPIAMHVYPGACEARVVAGDRASKWVKADIVVSPIEREVLASDALIEELGIVLLSPRRGYWRFADDPHDKVRASAEPEYW